MKGKATVKQIVAPPQVDLKPENPAVGVLATAAPSAAVDVPQVDVGAADVYVDSSAVPGLQKKKAAHRRISLHECQKVARNVLDIWFDQDFQETYAHLSQDERRQMFDAFAEGIASEFGSAVKKNSRSSLVNITLPFIAGRGEKAMRGEIKLHFPTFDQILISELAHDENGDVTAGLSHTSIVDVTFEAPWRDNKLVTVSFKYGWHDFNNPNKGFGFKHNGVKRFGDGTFEKLEEWLDFVVHKVIPILLKAKECCRKTVRDRSVGYSFQGTNSYGKQDGRMAEIIIDSIPRKNGLRGETFGWTSAFIMNETKRRSKPKPTAKKRTKLSSDESMIKRWRRYDRTIKKDDKVYVIAEDSKPFRWSLERGEAVYLWRDRDAGEAQIIHVKMDDRAEVDVSNSIEEARFGIDFAISHIENLGDTLGRFYSLSDRTAWVQRLIFFRDRVIPRMTSDQLGWFNEYFMSGFDYLLQLSESTLQHAAGEVVVSGMRTLYTSIYAPNGKHIDGVASFPVKIKSVQ
jgi:hypothetical protein